MIHSFKKLFQSIINSSKIRSHKHDIKFETLFSVYTSKGKIGEGGVGVVYRADDENGKSYAIKIIKQENVTNTRLKRFKNEVFLCMRNTDENIITLHDYGLLPRSKDRGIPFYVMPFYAKTLRTLMKEGLTPDKAIKYFIQILEGMKNVHARGIYHRDLKPENILYDSQKDILVVGDFGIAHFCEDYLVAYVETTHNFHLANFQYAAPEQRISGAEVNQKADIFALGLILNEMFTKRLALGTKYPEIADADPDYADLDELVEKMIRHSPEERPEASNISIWFTLRKSREAWSDKSKSSKTFNGRE